MSHHPERLAARYLTAMRPGARQRFESHLLACESCWQEVCMARRGRQLAETARDLAPAHLREDIRAAVATAALSAADPRPRRRIMATAAIAAVIAAGTVLARPWPHGQGASVTPPPVIAAAVASYLAGRLPGTAVPAAAAPGLAALKLRLVGAAAGRLSGVAVTMFSYRAPSGARLTIIRGRRPFPEAAEARELGGADGAWTMRSGGVTIICAQGTHAMLLLGSDTALVRQAGALLAAI
jgi:hypothetical protein